MKMVIVEAEVAIGRENKPPCQNAILTKVNGFVEWQVEINTLNDLSKLHEECEKNNPGFFSGLILDKFTTKNKPKEKQWIITIYNYYLD